mmetsp:Transcript_52522/g.151367  ORF Transcript_52522/g.151367 Transcript_52522/m.151367 type:complete len:733 (-) Transcript_52522:85-2283(-)
MAANGACAAFVWVAAVAAQLRPTEGRADCPLGAAGGRGYRWPQANPALTAPVAVTYNYDVYHNPLEAEMTGEAISISVPPDMFASFNMSDEQGAPQEQYVLRSMELRKPGQLPEGSSQVLSHVLELVLLHESAARKGTWATVVLPLAVAVDPIDDLLSSLLAGSRLPEDYGQRESLLMREAQPLDLASAFKDAAFLTYWTTLPSRCIGADASPARQLLRNSTLDVSQTTFSAALKALREAPAAPPLPSPTDAWLVRACPVPGAGGLPSPCKPMEAEDLSQPLLEAQTLQAQALSNLRAKKEAMDAALLALNNATSESYNNAVSAKDSLRDAEAELDAAAGNVARYEVWQNQAQRAVWSPVPPRTDGADSSAGPPPSGAALLAASRARRAGGAQGGAAARRGPLQGDCLALGLSPVALLSATASKQAPVGAVQQAIGFSVSQEKSSATSKRPSDAQLRAFNTGEYVRIVVPPHAGAALGSFTVGGRSRAITFADLHVPGEHTVDGRAADAELQLVHLPKSGGPAIAVSLLFDSTKEGADNAGLASFVAAMPRPRREGPIDAGPEAFAATHAVVTRGSAERYFRYNGTLTRSPCRVAEWFVVADRGAIGEGQVAALRAALPEASEADHPSVAADRRPPFKPSGLVLRDVQSLYGDEPSPAPVLAHVAEGSTPSRPAVQLLRRADSASAAPPAGTTPLQANQKPAIVVAERHTNRLINLLGQFRRSGVEQHSSTQ